MFKIEQVLYVSLSDDFFPERVRSDHIDFLFNWRHQLMTPIYIGPEPIKELDFKGQNDTEVCG